MLLMLIEITESELNHLTEEKDIFLSKPSINSHQWQHFTTIICVTNQYDVKNYHFNNISHE